MSSLVLFLQPALAWLPAFALVALTNLAVAGYNRPLGRLRWLLAAVFASAPALTPSPAFAVAPFGVLSTVLTTVAIVSAARLPDLDHALRTKPRRRLELFLWMSLPTVRFIPASPAARQQNRKLAIRYFLSAALKRLAWEPFAFLLAAVEGGEVPWPVRSAVLMLYFVLNLTAAADLVTGVCLLVGADRDDVFDAPLLSRSPRDFWSRRWNKFINRFALKHVALPIGRKWGPSVVIFVVFATSGAFHEYFAWGVGKGDAHYGAMMTFFVVQGVLVWLAQKLPPIPLPHAVGTLLTFAWMVATAPLFFWAVEPALHAFQYPAAWLPF